ncbi:glycosyltransferase family 2 protein [Paracoccus fontiphilus]|uniref:glycosyltransferase family 2 protein n=1 Tax=Paracoccus fontiphilus TaxID=1815556 RepID=UPI0024189FA5|nr:glycosyltransferase [Paracoccus fontiphilus]
MENEALAEVQSSGALSWSACIPTLNRFDVLQVNLRCLLAQSRLPKQVIIVDASQDAEQHRAALQPLFSGTGVEFILEPASARSSAVQRNQALSHVTADIVLLLDDDSLLFPDCAEKFLATFEADHEQRVAGLALQNVSELPPIAAALLGGSDQDASAIEQKKGGSTANKSRLAFLEKYRLWRFFRKEVLMQAMDRMFVPYDSRRPRPSLQPSDNLIKVRHLPGYGMAVRTHIAQREQFNPFLLAYCPCEDLDASYRYGRHGICAFSPDARLMHYEVEGSRITRMQATSLGVSNVALFIHTNSDSPTKHRAAFAVFALRRLVGETLKDFLSKRFDFPQAKGVMAAIPRSYGIFRRPLPDAQRWYQEQQLELLQKKKAA